MTWRSFMDFVLMHELGQQDSIVRNYDLTFWVDPAVPGRRYSYVPVACKRFGMELCAPIKILLDETRARLRNMGYTAGTDAELETLLNEWFIWHRIRVGELRNWRRKKPPNPLLD